MLQVSNFDHTKNVLEIHKQQGRKEKKQNKIEAGKQQTKESILQARKQEVLTAREMIPASTGANQWGGGMSRIGDRPARWETEGGDDAEVRHGKWGAAAAGEGEERNVWAG